MQKFKIGLATPLFFPNDIREYEYENELDYTQIFSVTDNIMLQLTSDHEQAPDVMLVDCVSGNSTEISGATSKLNNSVWLHLFSVSAPKEGCYRLEVGGHRSAPFEVTSNEMELSNTKLVRYTNASNNNALDTIFELGDEKFYFEFRVECGFRSNGLQPKLDAESFRDQHQRLSYLYQHPYLVETLTFGQASGLPACYVNMINRIFCCDSVSIDGEDICRSDGATPQTQQLVENGQMYVVTIDVEKKKYNAEYEYKPRTWSRYLTADSEPYVTSDGGYYLVLD